MNRMGEFEMIYYKNQESVAEGLKTVVDGYWELEVSEKTLVDFIKQVTENNKELIYKDGGYTRILEQRLGQRRLNLIDKILERGE